MLAANAKFGIAAAVGACYAPLAFINLPLAIVIWMPLAFLSHTGVVGSAPTVMMILLAVAWIGALPASRSQAIAVVRRHGVLFGCLAALLAWTTASLTWANDLSAAAGDLYWWYIAAAVFLVLVTTLRDRRYVVGACWAIVIGALVSLAVAATVGTESDAVLAAQDAGRIGTSGPQDPNYLAAALIPAAAIAAGLAALTRSGPWRLVLILAMGVLGIGLLATGSRGGVVAAAFAVAASLFLARGRRVQIGGLLAIAALVIGGWILTSSPETINRLQDFETGNGRVDLWSVALRMTGDNPIVGVGVNNFESESINYILQPGRLQDAELIVDSPHVVHNLYLQQLAETGVVGLALLLAVFAAAMVATGSAARRFREIGDRAMEGLASAVLVAQIGILSASVFLSNGYDMPLWLTLALGPMLVSVAALEARKATLG
jgi:O-antigen ligase